MASEDGVGRMILKVSNSINSFCFSSVLLSGVIWAGSDVPALALDVAVDELPRRIVSQRSRPPQASSSPGRFWPQPSKEEDAPPKVGGRSAGTRGCTSPVASSGLEGELRIRDATASATAMPALMLLAPVDAIAQTQSRRPTLAWYLGDDTVQPIIFRLYERSDQTPGLSMLYEYAAVDTSVDLTKASATPLQQKAGINYLDLASLPQAPELRPGGRYIWQVELVCDPRRPSGNLFAQAELAVVAPKTASTQTSADQTASTTNVTALLDQGLWQDALTASLARSEGVMDASGGTLLQSVVLNQAELEQLMRSPLHDAWVTP